MDGQFTDLMTEIGQKARAAAAERDLPGHIVTLSRSLIVPFLQFSPNRALREKAYEAWVARGANGGETDNRAVAAEILALRAERAQLLGYPDFAAFKLEPEMAKTPDAVRETLFNWLGQDLTGLACLDLFAGSGALGFEAASRGATHVTLVERDARTFAALRDAAAALGTERLELVRADAVKFLARATRRYDLLFLDPPYRQGWIERVAPKLTGVLTADARIYVEAEHFIERVGSWETVRSGRAGQVCYHLLEALQT